MGKVYEIFFSIRRKVQVRKYDEFITPIGLWECIIITMDMYIYFYYSYYNPFKM